MNIVRPLIASRQMLPRPPANKNTSAAEGGCGVIGIASSEAIAGRHLLQSLIQMRNRGNGKGGGIAAVGLSPEQMGVSRAVLEQDYLLTIAYLDDGARDDVEQAYIIPTFDIDHQRTASTLDDYTALPGLDVQPPKVVQYFVRVKSSVSDKFRAEHDMDEVPQSTIDDEIVYQNTFKLNTAFYAAGEETRAFVLSHGKNMMVLKMVGYGDDVVRYYQLEDMQAHVWIGHHRYPTKGRVWHPGGAHPFIGLHEALVHNGDFANYAAVSEYLAQRNIYPLFLTDTEVSVQVFDLLHRVYGYPLEYVIEALAPTTERDFTLLSPEKQRVYHAIQRTHIHGSPDGPWFFLIAQSNPAGIFRLIGITDTSMLRPQVFALQSGNEVSIGFAASEKQAIDAALSSLAAEDARFWPRADHYWNARGGSHTDGGAFIFSVDPAEGLVCTDKFGTRITTGAEEQPYQANGSKPQLMALPDLPAPALFDWIAARLPGWDYAQVRGCIAALAAHEDRLYALEALTYLMDRRYDTGAMRRSSLLSLYDDGLGQIVESVRDHQQHDEALAFAEFAGLPDWQHEHQPVLVDARGFPPEGSESLALALVELYRRGFRRFLVVHTRGHRFIANGFGPDTADLRIDVYGSPGDYLGSGIDGAALYVHGAGQDQFAQIMKSGKLVIYGDVGQTFGYAAKGGEAYIMGNTAGRPMINAVGKPRVVINGTSLDYLAEAFMAGDPLNGGGFVVLNGLRFVSSGRLVALKTPYPGSNLFSLASGGAIYLRDPHALVEESQLNGGRFVAFTTEDWQLIEPYLAHNEQLFDISIERLLRVDGEARAPEAVYRKVVPGTMKALQAEEAWVTGGEQEGK